MIINSKVFRIDSVTGDHGTYTPDSLFLVTADSVESGMYLSMYPGYRYVESVNTWTYPGSVEITLMGADGTTEKLPLIPAGLMLTVSR